MMNFLPTFSRGDSAGALEKERDRLADDEAAIAEAQREHEAKLPDADDSELVALEDKIVALEKSVARRRSKIALLSDRAASEERDRAAERYKAAVAAIEPLLVRRAKAAEGVERWLAGLAGATKEFLVATEGVLAAWPSDVPFPPRAYPGHALSLERLGSLIQQIFSPSRGRTDKRPPTPAEYLKCAADADRHHRTFATIERELGEQWLADLKTAHDPPPPVEDTAADEVAA
jgi:hypothetical protein